MDESVQNGKILLIPVSLQLSPRMVRVSSHHRRASPRRQGRNGHTKKWHRLWSSSHHSPVAFAHKRRHQHRDTAARTGVLVIEYGSPCCVSEHNILTLIESKFPYAYPPAIFPAVIEGPHMRARAEGRAQNESQGTVRRTEADRE